MASIQVEINDGLSSSTAVKGPCSVATTANITLSGEQTVDGVAVATSDRVLAKDQTTASENGIWIADTGPWRRSKDFNKTRDIRKGTMVVVAGGTLGSGLWQITTADPISVGTSNIAFQLVNPDSSTFVTLAGTQTLTNKTLTSPTINTPTINGGTIASATLTLKQSAAPTPTAEGDTQWDTDDNVLAIGDGAATKLFVPIPASTAAGDIEYFTGAKVKARLAKGTAGQTLRMNSGATAPEWVSLTGAPDAVLEDQKASATEGGTFTSGAWRTRDLNTEVRDPSSLVSIAANEFTPTVAGWVDWSAPASNVGQHKTRLFNVTDATVAGVGSSEQSAGSADTQNRSFGGAPVVAGKAYRIEHQCSSTAATLGFGRASGFATTVEVYTRVQFWRTA
ncbi:hypothetical protein [Mesorhizobium sp.]|uniref:hypothetical protein n=1 Tax=Mesorhizobium sp. TaxID=1871066 RepID=UPI001210452F|nr:hypothetical protein [Mesorhizobium sp.]TIO26943.1 MAG: hypothetical protein E5X83_06385 [Mesorhizobium sp.]